MPIEATGFSNSRYPPAPEYAGGPRLGLRPARAARGRPVRQRAAGQARLGTAAAFHRPHIWWTSPPPSCSKTSASCSGSSAVRGRQYGHRDRSQPGRDQDRGLGDRPRSDVGHPGTVVADRLLKRREIRDPARLPAPQCTSRVPRLLVLPALLLAPVALLRLLRQATACDLSPLRCRYRSCSPSAASLVLDVGGIPPSPLSLGLLLGAITALFLAGSAGLVAGPRAIPENTVRRWGVGPGRCYFRRAEVTLLR